MSAAESTAQQAADEAEGEEGGNWLVALAKALSESQAKFLDAAMENQKKMATSDPSGGTTDEAKAERKEFLKAQNEFQANMQMFNMTANTTATTLKSIGEGLTAIARKQ